MNKISLNIAVLLFLSFSFVKGQTYEPMEWGEVDQQDLELERYELDTAAHAVVLGDQAYVNVYRNNSGYIEWALRRHRRVKIIDEAGLNQYGVASIYYYHYEKKDKIKKIVAHSIAPDGTITEVKKAEIYEEKINDYWTKISFNFPNLTPGSVVEYRYTHFSQRWVVPEEWALREKIPVRSSYYEFGCTAPIAYTYLLKGAEYMEGKELPDGRGSYQLGEMNLLVDGPKFWMQNGQALREEPYMTTLEDYFIKIRFQASEIIYADGPPEPVYGTWENAAAELLTHSRLGETFLKRRNHKKLLADAILAIGASDDQDDLVQKITQFVQAEIKWSGKRGILTEGTLDDAYQLHEGGLPEMQYAGITLLRHYGIKADPVILSTRDNGAMITTFPFLDQFNYVVVLAQVNDRLQLLDFSDPFLRAGNISVQALNGQGFLIAEENPSLIKLSMPIFRDIVACEGQINTDGSIDGKMKSTMLAYSARHDRLTIDEDGLMKTWTDRLPIGGEWLDLDVQNEINTDEPLVVEGHYQLKDSGFANDDYLYVSPLVYSGFSESPFKLEKRSYPIDFPFPFEEKTIYSYSLPEGYIVEALPENENVMLPGNGAGFQYMAREKNDKITIVTILTVKQTKYMSTEYEALKSLFDTAAQKMQDQIVLLKN